MSKKISIIVDDEGYAEIRSPQDMTDEDVLDILTLAVDATADKILEDGGKVETRELQLPPDFEDRKKKKLMN